MEHLLAARAQMGTSLAFHFIFSALGIGLPVMLVTVEGLWLRTHDVTYYRIARTWVKALAVLFAIGAVSGTALSFELGLLWPEFMRHAGPIIGVPFSAEGFAFFIEAIFIGIYLYGWDRLTPLGHWLCGIPIAISGIASAIFVVSANAWMNTPTGFRLDHGHAVDINPVAAMLNPAFPTEAIHTILAAFVFVGFATASIYAVTILRHGSTPYLQRAMFVGMVLGTIAIPLQIIMGDVSARFDAHAEPMKFASLEGQFQTQRGAPLRIGGYPDEVAGKTIGAIEVPHILSFLAFEDMNAEVRGLRSFPQQDVPELVAGSSEFSGNGRFGFDPLFDRGANGRGVHAGANATRLNPCCAYLPSAARWRLSRWRPAGWLPKKAVNRGSLSASGAQAKQLLPLRHSISHSTASRSCT